MSGRAEGCHHSNTQREELAPTSECWRILVFNYSHPAVTCTQKLRIFRKTSERGMHSVQHAESNSGSNQVFNFIAPPSSLVSRLCYWPFEADRLLAQLSHACERAVSIVKLSAQLSFRKQFSSASALVPFFPSPETTLGIGRQLCDTTSHHH